MNYLSNVQIEFLKIVKSYLRGTDYRFPDDFRELPALYDLAVAHNLLPAVFERIREDKIWNQQEWKPLHQIWKRDVIRLVTMQIQRTEGFLAVYQKLKEQGIEPLVVKGLVCRNMYQKPDFRISGDEDIVIPRELVKKADQIFLQEGFERKEKGEDAFQEQTISYINFRNGVYIEVQPDLFEGQIKILNNLNADFIDMHETRIVEQIQGVDIYTLEPTKHFLYIIYHAFKHFIDGGVGIRQICDIVIMAEKYQDVIDWDYVRTRLRELRLDGFCKGLEQLAEHHLGFQRDVICCSTKIKNIEVDYVPLLLDLFEAGSFGNSSEGRKGSSGMTMMATDQTGNYLFPSYAYMKKSVSWVGKYPWLLPVAYLVRIVRYIVRSIFKKEEDRNSLQIGAERVELLKLYKIIR